MSMFPSLVAALAAVTVSLPAQQQPTKELLACIEAIGAPATTPEQRGDAVRKVLAADFGTVAASLVLTMEGCRIRRGPLFPESGIGPRTDEPWLEAQFSVEHRIQFTLAHVWWRHSRDLSWPEGMRVILPILEDPAGGEMRSLAIQAIPQSTGAIGAATELVPDGMARIEKLARTDPSSRIRAQACRLVVQESKAPGDFVDLAFEIAGTERAPMHQVDLLQQTGILAALPRMTKPARRATLRHAFTLLRQVDDGKGAGYSLALEIGRGLGIAPASPGSGPFAPDPRLPEFQGAHSLLPSFFQTAVANAFAWYDKHKDD